MRIETYTDERKAEVVQLIKEFFEESLAEFGQKFKLEALNDAIEKNKKHSFLLIIDSKCVGLVAGFEIKSPYNDERVFHEMVWYVNKQYRTKGVFLLKHTFKQLKELGFSQVIMTLMHNSKTEKLGRFYSRLGFVPFETHYLARL